MRAVAPALRGFPGGACSALRLLDVARYAFEVAPRSGAARKARTTGELFRGSLDLNTLEKMNGSYVSDDLRSRRSDAVWRLE